MKLRGVLVVLCMVQGTLIAQPVLTVGNSFPVAGDAFTELGGVALGPGGAGAGQVWDLSAFQPTDTFAIDYADEVSDSIAGCPLACLLGLTGQAYVVAIDPYSVMVAPWFGYPVGTLPTIHEFGIVLEAPMTFEDTVLNMHLYRLLTSGCDGFELWRADTNVADGYGTVVLPFGTYGPVLRVHTITEQPDPGADPMHAYRFYLPGTHHPLVTIAQAFPDPFDTTWTMRVLDPVSIVGLAEAPAQKTELTFRPQPVQDILFIQGIAGAAVRVDIFDASGSQVLLRAGLDIRNGIDVRGLPPGLYSLRLTHAGQPVRSGRFIKSDH